MKSWGLEQTDMAGGRQEPAWKTVAFVDDVFRHAFWPAKEFFYELVGAPLEAVLGARMPASVRRQMWQNGALRPTTTSAFPQGPETQWLNEFRQLGAESQELLSAYVDPAALHICYEASPGLLQFLQSRGVTYIDIRLSPVRFLPDVILAMRSNSPHINAALSRIGLSRYEIAAEATKLSASFRHRDRYTPQPNLPRHPGTQVVVVGQTSSDASIIRDDRFFHLRDAVPALVEQLQGKHVLYLRHPNAPFDHQRSEVELLASLYPALEVTAANSYDLLCSEQSLEFLGISSGLLQEAAFFRKKATSLLPPICPLAFADQPSDEGGYWQITFDTFMAPDFWRCLLGAQDDYPRDTLRNMVPNQLRELHNVWWGYPAHKVKANDYTRMLVGDVRPELQRVYGATRFVLDLIAGPQSAMAADEVMARQWRWPSGGIVALQQDGTITRDHRRAGTWRRLPHAEPSYFLVWDEGFWIDFARYAGNGRLACRNNVGDQFMVNQA